MNVVVSGVGSGSFSYTATDVGIESPDGSGTPLHDHSDQFQGFGYFDHILDDSSRISAIVGTSQQTFEIPNVRGLQPDLGLALRGRTDYASEQLDQRQRHPYRGGVTESFADRELGVTPAEEPTGGVLPRGAGLRTFRRRHAASLE